MLMLHPYTVDTATGSNSGLSVLLKDTSTRAGIEPPTPWLKDGPADHHHVTWNSSCMMLVPAAALPRLELNARGMENRWHSGNINEKRR